MMLVGLACDANPLRLIQENIRSLEEEAVEIIECSSNIRPIVGLEFASDVNAYVVSCRTDERERQAMIIKEDAGVRYGCNTHESIHGVTIRSREIRFTGNSSFAHLYSEYHENQQKYLKGNAVYPLITCSKEGVEYICSMHDVYRSGEVERKVVVDGEEELYVGFQIGRMGERLLEKTKEKLKSGK